MACLLPSHKALKSCSPHQLSPRCRGRPSGRGHLAGTWPQPHRTVAIRAAVAIEQTSRGQLQEAVSVLVERLSHQNDLRLDRGDRTQPEFQEPFAVLKAHHEHSPVDLSSAKIAGYFNSGLNTTNFISDEGATSLGLLTFQQVSPKQLKVQLVPGLYMEQGMLGHQSYGLFNMFRIVEGEHAGLEGISAPTGTYELDESRPCRQMIFFKQLTIQPKDSSAEGLLKWKAALQEANPNMAEDGNIVISFPEPIKGWRDFVYADDHLHITVGNRNSVVILRSCEEPSFTLASR